LKRSLFLAIAAIALVAVPRVSHAQLGLVKPISLGVAGGGALPMSDMSDVSKTGYNGTVALAIKLPFIPLGLRVDDLEPPEHGSFALPDRRRWYV
jgi:hypothetical protein